MINTCLPPLLASPMPESGVRIPPQTPLPSCPQRSVGLSLPVPINARLDLLVELAEQAGERTSRKEIVAVCILGAPRHRRGARPLAAHLSPLAGRLRLHERDPGSLAGCTHAAARPPGTAAPPLAPPHAARLTARRLDDPPRARPRTECPRLPPDPPGPRSDVAIWRKTTIVPAPDDVSTFRRR
jgi:hypothetical protein